MDDTDLRILGLLHENARASLKEISARVHLSQPATGERLRKLEKSGVIRGYTVLLDGEKLGRNLCCFCFVTLDSDAADRDRVFLAFADSHSDVLECHRIAGAHEYLIKVAAGSTKGLELFLLELRDRCGPARTATYTILSTAKAHPSLPPPGGGNGAER